MQNQKSKEAPQPSAKLKELKRKLSQLQGLEDQAYTILDAERINIRRINEHGLAEDGSDDELARRLALAAEALLTLREAQSEYLLECSLEGVDP